MYNIEEIYIVKKPTNKYYSNLLNNSLNLKDRIILTINNIADTFYYNQSDNSIVFSKTLNPGDKISIKIDKLDIEKDNLFSSSQVKPGILLKKYSDITKFKSNHTYKLNVIANKTKFDTMFSSNIPYAIIKPKAIRIDTGTLFDNISDETILRILYKNSKEAMEMFLLTVTDTTSIVYPTYLKNYIRYKTDLDLVNAAYLSISADAGVKDKRLGNMQISTDVKLPYLKDLVKRFSELLKPNEDALSGNKVVSVGFKKGGTSFTYPGANRYF